MDDIAALKSELSGINLDDVSEDDSAYLSQCLDTVRHDIGLLQKGELDAGAKGRVLAALDALKIAIDASKRKRAFKRAEDEAKLKLAEAQRNHDQAEKEARKAVLHLHGLLTALSQGSDLRI
ncbi:TPA: hypothetical protein ACOENG_000337 [Stenotrophomonas maltophilia]|uniref:Uncharacterized protein n=1 Tax=Stenotrophomonas maltophilia TaxID=40324 RepID=A0AAI9G2Y5_STEMA|nr:hypothetical protein [Stenotrophomonas maltophilia]EJP77289.1 hypothetical protein A1OC_02100 [Stenotrophomonas maltophilia Ab55555]EKT2106074.1 hypothetical protein [Stenotrophomonas maltophilia]EKT4071883.1 hypothetical protein [Stenotrophomonas maltophilia]EKT4079909.1 hypothetical protein [Stenotrophomonas maltophilia]EKZ1925527.1 hypothetical protein [Stenotrophomonas maltophilia]